MDPETGNAERAEKSNNVKKASSETAESPSAEVLAAASSQTPHPGSPVPALRKLGPEINEPGFDRLSRRELLKLSPIVLLGAFAVPSLQESLLKKGLGFSDWASRQLFRRGHLAPPLQIRR